MQLITDKTKIASGIKSIKGRIDTLKKDVHLYACSALNHAAEHGDTQYLTSLYRALGTLARREAFSAWAEAFSPARWNDKKKVFQVSKKAKAKGQVFDVEGGIAKPYYDFTREVKPEPFTFERYLKLAESLVKRADKAEEKGTLRMTDEQREIVDMFSAALEQRVEEIKSMNAEILQFVPAEEDEVPVLEDDGEDEADDQSEAA